MSPFNPQQAYDLAREHYRTGNLAAAETLCRQLLSAYPHHPEVLNVLALIARQGGRREDALEIISHALASSSTAASCHATRGHILVDLGRIHEAIASYQSAIRLQPDDPETYLGLGIAWRAVNENAAAIEAYRRAIQLQPDFAKAHNNLGNALIAQDEWEGGAAAFRAALRFDPRDAIAMNNLGNALRELGRLDAAIESYRQCIALEPQRAALHSNLVYAVLFHPSYDRAAIQGEQQLWNERHAAPLRVHLAPHPNERSPHRRLRIGYVSPNFRAHVVGDNLLPLLQEHDRSRCEIFCYSDTRPDELTPRFRALADQWRETGALSDEQLAAQIRRDGIDLLVDLTQHMAQNRLLVFARKPAPVQLSFAGYPGPTGLDSMDYRLTDPQLDPPDAPRNSAREEPYPLESFWCFSPHDSDVPVHPLPALASGQVTYGCLNNFSKVNDRVLALWSQILGRLGDARILMLSPPGEHRESIRASFATQGISRERVDFIPRQSRADYLAAHHRIDVLLDTFPYNGHTTTLDGLWMGVPVVSLVGDSPVARGGLSILTHAGLPELVARDEAEYVRIAVELACDLQRLAALRSALRPRLQASLLMDAPRFARQVEAAYREMWRRWCLQAEEGKPAANRDAAGRA